MAKFNAGDKVNLLSYEWLVETGVVREYGDSVRGIAKSDYERTYEQNPHTVYRVVCNAAVMFEPIGFMYANDCLELVESNHTTPKVDFDIPGSVNIMGVEYEVDVLQKLGDDESDGTGGFCDPDLKRIKLRDLTAIDEWKDEPIEKVRARMKMILRHEIVHAYLDESGLMYNSMVFGDGWARNEEMVDWFAIQGTKIMETWQKAGCL